jgi:hypothetical protein
MGAGRRGMVGLPRGRVAAELAALMRVRKVELLLSWKVGKGQESNVGETTWAGRVRTEYGDAAVPVKPQKKREVGLWEASPSPPRVRLTLNPWEDPERGASPST